LFAGQFSAPDSHSQVAVPSLAVPELILQAGHTFKINCLTFGANDKLLVSGGADHKIIVWDVAGGRELRMLDGHTGYLNALAVSNDGKFLVSGSNDHFVKLWDVSSGRELKTFTVHTQ
jgi:WD40 repeat protein